MKITEKNTKEIRHTLNELIGNVTARNLFTGYGLFHQDIMFGLYQSGIFYLKAENELATHLENQGAVSYLTSSRSPPLNIGHYYRLPQAVIQDKAVFKRLVILSIQQIRAKKLAEALAKKNRIKELPNLSIKHERLLAKINIQDIATFKTVGAANCFVRLKKEGVSVNLLLFWNLTAALLNKNVNLLTEKERTNALNRLNTALVNAGFRKIKLPDQA
ncbi:TfoX/Sxy family DNA transformation protein [Caviibacterium pharyngocola]|uniref:DNA transformation protein n=1 Tax=Caviibacterium pharyngocola TaxID=28159 RepID=A0A2M8RUJ4_9PAST|nr:TfoX/Sxy family DNA transformation protein [Caviibacterium pharyngocola]PJG82539.1 DNA transformation protein [Caviibacterium pharyngocola]